MRLIVHNKRDKKVFQMSMDEFKSGAWLKDLPTGDLVEVTYKNGFLTIADAEIRRLGEKPKMEETDDGKDDSAD